MASDRHCGVRLSYKCESRRALQAQKRRPGGSPTAQVPAANPKDSGPNRAGGKERKHPPV